MATNTHKYSDQMRREARHSALEEFSRDERRPAVLLLSALVLAVLFFAIGLLVGRWTAEPNLSTNAASQSVAATQPESATPDAQPAASPATNSSGTTSSPSSSDAEHRFALLVATYDAPEKAQPLIKTLQEAGYKDIRTSSPQAGQTHARYSLLVGRFTQAEAREAARRMRSANDPRLKSAKVIEEQ